MLDQVKLPRWIKYILVFIYVTWAWLCWFKENVWVNYSHYILIYPLKKQMPCCFLPLYLPKVTNIIGMCGLRAIVVCLFLFLFFGSTSYAADTCSYRILVHINSWTGLSLVNGGRCMYRCHGYVHICILNPPNKIS